MSTYYNPQGGGDHRILHALDVVSNNDGLTLDIFTNRSQRKFGSNVDIDTGDLETIWSNGDDEVYQTTNSIDTVSSSSGSDTQTIVVQGHTMSATGLLTRVTQSVVLTGQTKALLDTPLARVERGYNSSPTDIVGDVHVYRDTTLTGGVPTDLAFSHMIIEARYQQSQKCAFSTTQDEYFFIMETGAITLQGSNAHADFALETRHIQLTGLVFRNQLLMSAATTGGDVNLNLDPVIIVPANHDVRMRAQSNTNNIGCAAYIAGYYMDIKNYISPDA